MNQNETITPRDAIERFVDGTKDADETKEWIKELYKSLNARFLSDNNRIWSSAAVFVPVAFAAFAALVNIKQPTWHHALVLGIASTGLLAYWASIADRHREFQDQVVDWLIAIEERAGLPEGGSWKGPPVREQGMRVQDLRWTLVGLVFFAWLALILWTGIGGF
jgi:hypothetical protein